MQQPSEFLSIFYLDPRIFQQVNDEEKIERQRRSWVEMGRRILAADSPISSTTSDIGALIVNLKTKEDFIFWLMLLKQNHAIEALDVNLSYWRKLNDSLSSSSIQKLTDGFKVYYKYMNFSLIKSAIYLALLSFNYILKELKNK